MTIEAAADGSALGNPGPAGWAWYVDEDHWASGGWAHGTNNMGELTAVLELLRATAHLDDDLLVYCDSTYTINTITKWMAGWKRKGWRKRDGNPVMNLEIVQALDAAMAGRRVRFEWVKGHAGHELNEAADRLANAAALAFKEGSEPEPGPGYGVTPVVVPDPTPPIAPSEDEPDLFSELEVDPLDEVVELERSLLRDDVRADAATVAALLHPDWIEVGRSGRLWSRAEMLDAIGPLPGGCELETIEVREVSEGIVRLLWRSSTDEGSAVRSSWWLREGRQWRQVFHQGTSES